jgi:myo-inositol catabolism protein IolC
VTWFLLEDVVKELMKWLLPTVRKLLVFFDPLDFMVVNGL